jgi:hypothetical protein
MECMKKSDNHYESRFWQILEKNRLVDLSQFHKPHFFEEVPLYSRLADVSFLSEHSADEASAIVLRFALKFLKSVISYEQHDTPFFAAITVSNFSEGDPIVPNLFVWSNPLRELYDKLTLNAATTPFGEKIKRLVSQLHLPDRLFVFDDTSTTADISRAFIAPALPPYDGFVPIYMFCKAWKLIEEQVPRRKQPK